MDESIESKPFAEEASLPELTPDIRDDDYSDVASHDSQDEQTERRRYQRGGRKKTSQKSSRMPPVGEPPVKPENNKQTQTDEDLEYEQPQPRRERPRPRRESPNPRNQPTKPPTDFATGIRSFNVRRATGSGGRPVSVRSVPGKSKTKKKAKPKKEEENSDPEEQYIESQTEQDEEDEEPPQKPMSIRLDLNIVLEVFLKAKIQGDVTITFLDHRRFLPLSFCSCQSFREGLSNTSAIPQMIINTDLIKLVDLRSWNCRYQHFGRRIMMYPKEGASERVSHPIRRFTVMESGIYTRNLDHDMVVF